MRAVLGFGVLCILAGCGEPQAPVSQDMVSSPVGLWVSTNPTGIDLDIDPSGSMKVTKNGTEQLGSWKKTGEGKVELVLNGSTTNSDFQRKDQKLTLTVPGDTTPTEFNLM